jgi:hypothetical protein
MPRPYPALHVLHPFAPGVIPYRYPTIFTPSHLHNVIRLWIRRPLLRYRHRRDHIKSTSPGIPTHTTGDTETGAARKTIAVRECDGLYNCCMEAVEGFEDHSDFTQRLHDHASTHCGYVCAESYLQRLWTLPECLLSHTIEFVVGRNSTSCDIVIQKRG